VKINASFSPVQIPEENLMSDNQEPAFVRPESHSMLSKLNALTLRSSEKLEAPWKPVIASFIERTAQS
jgi:hypothetical protein